MLNAIICEVVGICKGDLVVPATEIGVNSIDITGVRDTQNF